MYLPEKDRSYVTKGEMFEDIVSSLGGRVAEQLILEDISCLLYTSHCPRKLSASR